jgi:hypothetical protein
MFTHLNMRGLSFQVNAIFEENFVSETAVNIMLMLFALRI